MIKVLQITIEANKGSIGRISEQIGEVILNNSWESYIAFSRPSNESKSITLKIGSKLDMLWHGLETRVFDNHCFSSEAATKKLITSIKKINPDIIHLHHLHGYFLNIEVLFSFLNRSNIPVVWTFHDCWSFTGHCTHFEFVKCEKWKTQCYDCEQKHEYPRSFVFDRSRQNFIDKKRIFNSISNLTIVSVSNWLSEKVKDSFLSDFPQLVIKNGIDLNVFFPKNSKNFVFEQYKLQDKFLILGVASNWNLKKGFYEFLKLANLIDSDKFAILLVGLSENQIKGLPKNIIGISRTENVEALADLYSAADVFFNPTFEDSYPTTNLESIACGTPVISYNTGGSVESITKKTGIVVNQGDLTQVVEAIDVIFLKGKDFYIEGCREFALSNFDNKVSFNKYLNLYKKLVLN